MFSPAYSRPFEPKSSKSIVVSTFLTLSLLTSCSSILDENQFALSSAASKQPGSTANSSDAESLERKKELRNTLTYWGQQYAQNSRDVGTAIGYATSLKNVGQYERAYAVLESAYKSDPKNRELNSEYGRIALQVGKNTQAEELLNKAGGFESDDWKTVSAKGVLLSKRGDYRGAQKYFKKALVLRPDQPSIISNLALSYMLIGKPDLAEKYIRQASELAPDNKQVKQNLALVLGVRGNFEEAENIASQAVPGKVASANAEYLQSLIKAPDERWVTRTNKDWVAQVTSETKPLPLKKASYPPSTNSDLASIYND